jgi:hypothetical protein
MHPVIIVAIVTNNNRVPQDNYGSYYSRERMQQALSTKRTDDETHIFAGFVATE